MTDVAERAERVLIELTATVARWFVGYVELDAPVCAHCREAWDARMHARGVERGRMLGLAIDLVVIVLALTRLSLTSGLLVVAIYHAAGLTLANIILRHRDAELIDRLRAGHDHRSEDQR